MTPETNQTPAVNAIRLFVAGTDTGVGKSVIAAALVRTLEADYWKPIQSGAQTMADPDSDSHAISTLTGLAPERIHPPAYSFAAAVSPHEAGAHENATIDLAAIRPPNTERPLIVEGAGGVLVPLAPGPGQPGRPIYMMDLIVRLNFPVIVVSRNVLGAINHTLLTLEALRLRGIAVLGVILNNGNMETNAAAIEEFGNIRVLHVTPHFDQLDPEAIDTIAAQLRDRLEALA